MNFPHSKTNQAVSLMLHERRMALLKKSRSSICTQSNTATPTPEEPDFLVGDKSDAVKCIWIYELNDCDFWAGPSLQACIDEARKQFGDDYCDDPSMQGPISEWQMNQFRFIHEDLSTTSFREELLRLMREGEEFPCLFASTEF